MMEKNSFALFFVGCFAVLLLLFPFTSSACTRVVYLGPDGMIITGRTMDWREDIRSNIYLFPRGLQCRGSLNENTLFWKSKYGSVVTAAYDLGTTDGMNERGLVANLLYLSESDYYRPDDNRPIMNVGVWAQYVLDNFASVSEAVAELSKETFRMDAPPMPNGSKSTLHLALSDSTGNSAILEYIDGRLVIHEGRQYQVMTNSPTYDKQLAINDYWKQIGGTVMLPGTNRAADRFVRASFYINAVTQTSEPKEAAACVMSVIRNVSVPMGITTPDQPNISSTRWRTLSDQKNRVYFFESTLNPNTFWIEFGDLDFAAGAPMLKLALTEGGTYLGNVAGSFHEIPQMDFLEIQERVMAQ